MPSDSLVEKIMAMLVECDIDRHTYRAGRVALEELVGLVRQSRDKIAELEKEVKKLKSNSAHLMSCR